MEVNCMLYVTFQGSYTPDYALRYQYTILGRGNLLYQSDMNLTMYFAVVVSIGIGECTEGHSPIPILAHHCKREITHSESVLATF